MSSRWLKFLLLGLLLCINLKWIAAQTTDPDTDTVSGSDSGDDDDDDDDTSVDTSDSDSSLDDSDDSADSDTATADGLVAAADDDDDDDDDDSTDASGSDSDTSTDGSDSGDDDDDTTTADGLVAAADDDDDDDDSSTDDSGSDSDSSTDSASGDSDTDSATGLAAPAVGDANGAMSGDRYSGGYNSAEAGSVEAATVNGVLAAVCTMLGIAFILAVGGFAYYYRKDKARRNVASIGKEVAMSEVQVAGNEEDLDALPQHTAYRPKIRAVDEDDASLEFDGQSQDERDVLDEEGPLHTDL